MLHRIGRCRGEMMLQVKSLFIWKHFPYFSKICTSIISDHTFVFKEAKVTVTWLQFDTIGHDIRLFHVLFSHLELSKPIVPSKRLYSSSSNVISYFFYYLSFLLFIQSPSFISSQAVVRYLYFDLLQVSTGEECHNT